MAQISCTFHSVWNNGEYDIATDALYDPDTGLITNIEMIDASDHLLSKLDVLDREYIEVGDEQFDANDNGDGTYSAVSVESDRRTWYIGVVRYGYIEVEADSEQDAVDFAETLDEEDFEWDDEFFVDPNNIVLMEE